MKKTLSEKIKEKYSEKSQIKTIEFQSQNKEIVLFYIESLVDKTLFSASILSPLQSYLKSQKNSKNKDLFKQIKTEVLTMFSIEECRSVNEILQNILSGSVVLVVAEKAMNIPIYSAQKRGIQEPPTSKVIKGPREGFVEDIYTNLGLIRKRLKTPNLELVDLVVGKQTNTNITVV